jgi:hypothetical protein
MLPSEYFLANIGFDTAENDPSNMLCKGSTQCTHTTWILYPQPRVNSPPLNGGGVKSVSSRSDDLLMRALSFWLTFARFLAISFLASFGGYLIMSPFFGIFLNNIFHFSGVVPAMPTAFFMFRQLVPLARENVMNMLNI